MEVYRTEKSETLNGYDLFKTFAIITMIIDHVGYFAFPDDLWLRAVGRLSFPVWFFLIGYARSRDISPKLLVGAAILIGINLGLGIPTFPLNALCTIILVRLILDTLSEPLDEAPWVLWPMTAILTLLVLPAGAVTEYGSLAVMFALLGYLARNKGVLPYTDFQRAVYMMTVVAIYVVYQTLNFGFGAEHFVPLAISMFFLGVSFLRFQGAVFAGLQSYLPEPTVQALKFCGSRTLEIYVAHLILFKILWNWPV